MDKIEDIKNYGQQNGYPIIKDAGLIKLLEVVQSQNPKSILEIGTAIGYSGSLMLGSCDATLVTIELNKDSADLAMKNFCKMGLESRVRLINADANDVLDDLLISKDKFDLIFLDGAKGQYINYLERILLLLNDDGYLVADNVLFRGYLNDGAIVPRRFKTIVKRLKMFNNAITTNDGLDTIIYNVGDGVSVSKKIRR